MLTYLGGIMTAALTWLVIELAIKPRVDARRQALAIRRELLALVAQLSLSATWLAEELPRQMHQDVRQQVNEDRRRNYARIRELTLQLFDNIGKYAGVYPARPRQSRDATVVSAP